MSAAPTATAAAKKPGGTLTIDTGTARIRNLDPAKFQFTTERVAVNQVTENLVYRNKDMKLEPKLATAWRVAADGITWTFELRKDVKFTDGTPFNAEAVKANVARWTDPKNTGNNTREFRNVFESTEVVSDLTVRFKTKGAQPHMVNLLAAWGTQIISPTLLQRAAVFGDEVDTRIIGTGPFKVESFVSGENLTLVRNEDYWGDKALLDKVVFRPITDASARTAALIGKQVDLSLVVPANQVAALKSNPAIQLAQQPALYQQWFEFNLRRPPLDKPEVRQALNYAINWDAIKSVVYEGFLAPFQGPINPTVFSPDPPVAGFSHDPNKAKALLQQAGVSNLKLKLVYVEATVPQRYAELVQAQLKDVGVELELVKMDLPAQQQAKAAGQYDLTSDAHGNSIGVPAVIWSGTLHSKKGFLFRPTGYANAKIDKLVDDALLELDEKKRTDLLTEVFREFFKDPPWLGMAGGITLYAHTSRVQGFVTHPDQDLPLAQMWFKD